MRGRFVVLVILAGVIAITVALQGASATESENTVATDPTATVRATITFKSGLSSAELAAFVTRFGFATEYFYFIDQFAGEQQMGGFAVTEGQDALGAVETLHQEHMDALQSQLENVNAAIASCDGSEVPNQCYDISYLPAHLDAKAYLEARLTVKELVPRIYAINVLGMSANLDAASADPSVFGIRVLSADSNGEPSFPWAQPAAATPTPHP